MPNADSKVNIAAGVAKKIALRKATLSPITFNITNPPDPAAKRPNMAAPSTIKSIAIFSTSNIQ